MSVLLSDLDYPLATLWRDLEISSEFDFDPVRVNVDVPKHRKEDISDVVKPEECLTFVRSLEDSEDRFAVLVSWQDYHTFWPKGRSENGNALSPGWTVVTFGGHIITYQPVVLRVGSARSAFVTFDGVIFELDKEFVSAWDGRTPGLATSRFLGQKHFN